jgi:hypothetical protein
MQRTGLDAARRKEIYSVFPSHVYALGRSIRLFIGEDLELMEYNRFISVPVQGNWKKSLVSRGGQNAPAADQVLCHKRPDLMNRVAPSREKWWKTTFHISFCHSPWQHKPRRKVNIKTHIPSFSSKAITKLKFLSKLSTSVPVKYYRFDFWHFSCEGTIWWEFSLSPEHMTWHNQQVHLKWSLGNTKLEQGLAPWLTWHSSSGAPGTTCIDSWKVPDQRSIIF